MPDGAADNAGAERTVRRCLGAVLLGSCGVIALGVLARFTGDLVWDDAFMFVRYADQFLSQGVVAWNPGGAPTYGLTSLGCLALYVPIRLLVPANAPLAAMAQSLLAGVAFLALMAALVLRHADAGPLGRRFLAALVFFLLALGITHLNQHFASGMDTMLAMAWLAGYLLLAKGQERSPGAGRAIAAGVWGGLTYLVRPELMLYAAAVPLALLAADPDRRRRGHALLMGGVTLLVLAGVGVVARWRRRREGSSAVDWALAGATALFFAYQLGWTFQIMGFAARFYCPALPALLFLAVQGAAALLRAAAPALEGGVVGVPRPPCWLAALLALAALTPQARTAAQEIRDLRREGAFARFDLRLDCQRNWPGSWPRLDLFAGLPDDLVIAATDVGRPGALAPRKRVVDLAGLNETALALRRFSAERLFRTCQPDLLYMPLYIYRDMIADLRANPYFRDHYELFPAKQLAAETGVPALLDVALRKDSPHYPAMRAILLSPWTPPPGPPAAHRH